jgi:hypothetical protein
VNFRDIVQIAIEKNCDIDKDGNIDGAVFAAEQIIQDMDKAGYKIMTKARKQAASGIDRLGKQPKKKKVRR